MGNGQSSLSVERNNDETVPTLDFDNMPFLRPPNTYSNFSSPEITELGSPMSQFSEWNQGHAKVPTYHHRHGSSLAVNSGQKAELSRSPASDHSFQSEISSQLSVLSRKQSLSPKSRHSFSQSHPVDASIPPMVPPHLIIPSSARHNDLFMETALAAVDAMEFEAEEDLNLQRSRPRSTSTSRPRSLSRSRSRSRPRSSSSASSCSGTDIYTRKCPSPDSQRSETELDEPVTPDRSSFALDGYSDGYTQLRVVNTDSYSDTHTHSNSMDPSEKYFVKSKAQLAEEEELRQRKRYARYGQPFRGKSTV